MSKSAGSGQWVPLMDYAMKKGISLSTLRRYIKANKVVFKVEGGRYLLFDESDDEGFQTDEVPGRLVHDELRLELQKAREEIAELKTLIAFYEEKNTYQNLDA